MCLVTWLLLIQKTLTKSQAFMKTTFSKHANYSRTIVLPLAVEAIVELVFRFASITLFIVELSN